MRSTAPLVVGAANVAPAKRLGHRFQIRPGAEVQRSASTSVPSGAIIISDPVDLTLPPTSDLAVGCMCPAIPRRAGRR
jgi:hypothetical protein